MTMKSEIEAALQAHSLWRERFKDILNGRAPFDLNMISSTSQCVLGQWLSKEGKQLIPPALHSEICLQHQEFHQIAAGIIQNIKDKNFTEAKHALELKGPLNQASLRLRSQLTKMSFMAPAVAKAEDDEPSTGKP